MMQPESAENPFPFEFLRRNPAETKPRLKGLTEIRGPYYTVMGKRYLQDILETMGPYIDSLKFAGGAFTLIPRRHLQEMIDLCHAHEVMVSTGGFIEHALTMGREAVRKYIGTCRDLGFDIIELSAGFITLPTDDWLKLIKEVRKGGMKAKPEIGIQFGAGGNTASSELEAAGRQDARYAIMRAKRFLEAGAYMLMIESEGITENVENWRTEVPAQFIDALGLENLMFEAADPPVFQWYIRNYGPDVNVFVDHSQIVQLETLRAGIWGPNSLWGRVVSF